MQVQQSIFPDVAADFASGDYVADWQDLGRGFVDQSIPEEEEEEEEEHFLMTSWSGPSKHLHHQPVSPDRTRSLSLENDLPVSFLIRSAALEDLTTVGDKGVSVSEEFLQQGPCTDSTERGHEDVQQTVTDQQKMTEFGDKDIPSIATLHPSTGDLSPDPSCEYDQESATPKQDFGSTLLPPQGHTESVNSVSVRDSLVLHEGNHSDLVEYQSSQLAHHPGSPETEGKEVRPPFKDPASSPVTSYGSSTRKSRVPVSQFKGL